MFNKLQGYQPVHCNIAREDTNGNHGKGRIFIIPGSHSRTENIACDFIESSQFKISDRGHHLYLGNYDGVDIGVISTGMGCPSLDIIVTELAMMGAKHFIRIGTAGAVDENIKVGDIVIATGAVRDEGTSRHYAPIEVPAVGNWKLVSSLAQTAGDMGASYQTGIIHTKDSLFAREFQMGAQGQPNLDYMNTLKTLGVLASEMESSHLFILGMTYKLNCAAICSIIGDSHTPFSKDSTIVKETIETSIRITLEALRAYLSSL